MNHPLMSNNITREDLNCVVDFLNQDPIPQLTNGPKVKDFEREFSKWLGVSHSVTLNSGSSANELSFLVLKHIKEKNNDNRNEVICPPLGWVSDYAAILQNNFCPVFADIKMNNLALDIEEVKKKITDKTIAILLIHILGYNGISDELIELCKKEKIFLIEDVCESPGATYKGKKVGSFGDISNFSGYFAHHFSMIEAGILSTNNDEIFQLARSFRAHSMNRELSDDNMKRSNIKQNPELNPDFIFLEAAHNFRPNEITGVLGLSQIKRLDENNKKRAHNLEIFLNHLDSNKYYKDFLIEGNSSYAFTVVLKDKDLELRDRMEKRFREYNVEFRRGASGGGNILRQPFLKKRFGELYKEFPVTEHIHFFSNYIGNWPDLSKEKILWLTKEVLNKV